VIVLSLGCGWQSEQESHGGKRRADGKATENVHDLQGYKCGMSVRETNIRIRPGSALRCVDDRREESRASNRGTCTPPFLERSSSRG